MPVLLDIDENISGIRLEGDITIASANELKNLLVEALAAGRELHVMLESATELDVTAVQLLWAAGCEARRLGVRFVLAGSLPEGTCAIFVDTGLDKFLIAEKLKANQKAENAVNCKQSRSIQADLPRRSPRDSR